MPLIPAYFKRACLLHHQAYDGTGYPSLRNGIEEIKPYSGSQIPIIARIAAVADVYDAVTSPRAWRLPYHPIAAAKILQKESGKKLDPIITEAFLEKLCPFPEGSTVMLSTGELAVVMGYADGDKTNPIVKPYMRKTYKDGKEVIIRLPYRENIEILPESKIKIIINKNLYELEEEGIEDALPNLVLSSPPATGGVDNG